MASITSRIQRTGISKKAKEVRVETKAAAKEKMGAARTPNEIDEPLSPDVQARLAEIVARVVSLHRKSTGQIFELGACLAEAKSVQPEKRFGRWLKDNCGYSVRSAWNFISVHERLADHRERLAVPMGQDSRSSGHEKGARRRLPCVADDRDQRFLSLRFFSAFLWWLIRRRFLFTWRSVRVFFLSS